MTSVVSPLKKKKASPGIQYSSLNSLCDWSGKLTPLSQPIRCKTNHNLVARVFPRFEQFGGFYFESSLAAKGIFLSSD